jgi:phosphohistidine phosphatase SixA
MIVKHGEAKIMNIIKDSDHNLDDEGTREVMKKAVETSKKELEKKDEASKEN